MGCCYAFGITKVMEHKSNGYIQMKDYHCKSEFLIHFTLDFSFFLLSSRDNLVAFVANIFPMAMGSALLVQG